MAEDQKPQAAPQSTVSTWWILAAIALILVALYAAVQLSAEETEYVYNGFRFERVPCPDTDDECWSTNVQLNIGVREVTFFNGPREVEDVFVHPNAVAAVLNLTYSHNTSVIIAFDEDVPGEIGIAASNIARITGERLYNISTQGAVYGEQVTCAASRPDRIVIYLTQTDEGAGAGFRDGCVIIGAPDASELLRAADAYTLHLLRIMY